MRSVVCSSSAVHDHPNGGEGTQASFTHHHNDTKECDSLLNISRWTVDDFIKHYMGSDILNNLLSLAPSTTDPPSLMQLHMHMMGEQPMPSQMPESASVLQRIDESALLWDGPNAPGWVACNQRNKTCYGKIPKSLWQNPATRGPSCIQEFNRQVRLGNVNSSAVGLDVCNLNSKLGTLCDALQQARRMVQEANCLFAGVCAPQVFVYSPGTYSSSNQDFVRGTVSSFYEMFRQVSDRREAAGATPGDEEEAEFYAFRLNKALDYSQLVCPLDDMELELKLRNEAIKGACFATRFTPMKDVLYGIRRVVHMVATIMYSTMQFALCLIRLLIPIGGESSVRAAMAELGFWFNKLIISLGGIVKQLADMLFELIFSFGDLGPGIKKAIEALCNFVNLVLHVWNISVCEYLIKPLVAPALRFLTSLIAEITSFFRREK